MVGAGNNGEIPFGFTADGLYEIILRPGKFFFREKCIILKFFSLSIFKNRVNV